MRTSGLDTLRRTTTAWRRIATLCGLLCVLLLAGCSNEAERIVETWEELGEVIEDHRDDCAELAEALTEFEDEHGEMFAADTRPLYEEIHADPDLRFRMERAFARIEAEDFECRDNEAVQAAASALFGEIIEETETAEAQGGQRNPGP